MQIDKDERRRTMFGIDICLTVQSRNKFVVIVSGWTSCLLVFYQEDAFLLTYQN